MEPLPLSPKPSSSFVLDAFLAQEGFVKTGFASIERADSLFSLREDSKGSVSSPYAVSTLLQIVPWAYRIETTALQTGIRCQDYTGSVEAHGALAERKQISGHPVQFHVLLLSPGGLLLCSRESQRISSCVLSVKV